MDPDDFSRRVLGMSSFCRQTAAEKYLYDAEIIIIAILREPLCLNRLGIHPHKEFSSRTEILSSMYKFVKIVPILFPALSSLDIEACFDSSITIETYKRLYKHINSQEILMRLRGLDSL